VTGDPVREELLELGAATLGESGGLPMAPRIRPAWAGARVAGPAYTVACAPADNLAIHVAVTRAGPGSVLVVDAAAVPERGYWGEVLTTAAEAAGVAGLVIDGGVRDVAALQAHGFPVFSALVALPGATKGGPGTVGCRVDVGGVALETGDWVVADADGVTVVPAAWIDDVAGAGRTRAAKEQGMFTDLRSGRTTMDLLGLDPSAVEGA
jgi:4-hydroxy-4-methyl-2-oxoglutarate aldolase